MAANLRAARALQAAHAGDRQALGATAWPSPRVLDWKSWINELWEQYTRRADSSSAVEMPLTALQEHQLWKQVQGADRDRVVAPQRMADLAQQAYALLGDYDAHPLRVAAAAGRFGTSHEDAARFLVWAADFDRLCQRHGWLSSTRLAQRLAAAAGVLDQPDELWLVGFDRVTPGQGLLLDALAAAGTRVHRYQPAPAASEPLLVRADHPQAEYEACAWWCREQLAHPPHADGSVRIGVIVPDLERVRAELDRVFRRILMPQTCLWPSDGAAMADPPMPYEFSLGTSLAAVPIVGSALRVLRWLAGPLDSTDLTWLLNSGFLAGSAADHTALAMVDASVRRTAEVSMAWFAERSRSRSMPQELGARLRRLAARGLAEGRVGEEGRTAVRRRSYASWAELVPTLLEEAGWPGYRPLDSFNYQAQQRWTRLLGELAELGFDGSEPSWGQFLRTLEQHAHGVIFAAESTDPPIQILGAFESSGQSFDAVWLLGADDQHWPSTGQMHPLLAAGLQREARMPHASPEADWVLAQEATTRIVASAPTVRLSYAAQAQGIALRASPLVLAQVKRPAAGEVHASAAAPRNGVGSAGLIASLTGAVAPPARIGSQMPTATQYGMECVELDSVRDDSGVLPWPEGRSAGGAEVLKRQAECAFRSFAVRRLRADALEDAEHGLDPRMRGTLMHRVLQSLWSSTAGEPMRLHTLNDLLRATEEGYVADMVTYHVNAVFASKVEEARGDAWRTAYLACEQQRVRDRLLEWLACEREREPFTVFALEQALTSIEVGPLRLDLRPDRVDTLDNGTCLLLDYKTGEVKPSAWDGERPEEPQLPLYAIFGGMERVSGVAFGQIRAPESKLVVRGESVQKQVSAAVTGAALKNRLDDATRESWAGTLVSLASDFVRGDARVNPRDHLKTCRYCPLPGLCRVHETDTLPDDEEEGLEGE
ncbi:MAG TPA: PD-(D/E)XK nuclease family protein [Acidobacteriaceae bacterium]